MLASSCALAINPDSCYKKNPLFQITLLSAAFLERKNLLMLILWSPPQTDVDWSKDETWTKKKMLMFVHSGCNGNAVDKCFCRNLSGREWAGPASNCRPQALPSPWSRQHLGSYGTRSQLHQRVLPSMILTLIFDLYFSSWTLHFKCSCRFNIR